jgi:hypothetical protein
MIWSAFFEPSASSIAVNAEHAGRTSSAHAVVEGGNDGVLEGVGVDGAGAGELEAAVAVVAAVGLMAVAVVAVFDDVELVAVWAGWHPQRLSRHVSHYPNRITNAISAISPDNTSAASTSLSRAP